MSPNAIVELILMFRRARNSAGWARFGLAQVGTGTSELFDLDEKCTDQTMMVRKKTKLTITNITIA